MSALRRRRPEDDALAVFVVIVVIITIVSLLGACLHRDPHAWPGWSLPDSTRCHAEQCT